MTTSALAHDAESLVRSLDGVVSAHVQRGSRGIDAIHVTASDHDTARFLAAHVRSALLAGLATPVTAARIHVTVEHALEHELADPLAREHARHADSVTGAAAGHTNGNGPGDALAHDDPPAAAPARDPGEDPPEAADDEPGRRGWMAETRGPRPRLPGRFLDEPVERASTAPADDAAAGEDEAEIPVVRRPRLVAVDVERPGDGRVLCRVAVAYGTFVHRAEAVAVDLPGAAAQAAAQAAVRALIDAGMAGLELNGLREVEIAGREYVLVALNRTDTSRRLRSGSAPIIGSAERSAAEAAVAAANNLI